MKQAILELAQAAAALWLIPIMPVVAAFYYFGWWGLYLLGWTGVWFLWLMAGEQSTKGDEDDGESTIG